MSLLSINVADEDLSFLREWASEHGTSAEAFLAEQAKNLRQHLQRKLHPVVRNATGAISANVDAPTEYFDYLERKHK